MDDRQNGVGAAAPVSSVIWIGGVRVDDIVKSQTNVSARVKERKDAFIQIFQEISQGRIARPINKNFCWEWSKNWIIVVFDSQEAATAVKTMFDTWAKPTDTAQIKAEKVQRAARLSALFSKHGMEWESLVVDYKAPKRKVYGLSDVQDADHQRQVVTTGRGDPGIPQTGASGSEGGFAPSIHQRHWSFAVTQSGAGAGVLQRCSNSTVRRQNMAASVGHANANGDVWSLMGSDGSNISRDSREAPDSTPHQPTVVSMLDHPKHRIVIVKFALPLDHPALVGVVPLENAEGSQPDASVLHKFAQNIVL